ncbi:MAG: hypothetical protein JXR70_11570 [Spirochaetales bacterium]|nr:hypothetical protein [Spirochaetales bacterium]
MIEALGIGAMSCHFFKNGRTKRFCADIFRAKTFGGGAGVAQSPVPESPRAYQAQRAKISANKSGY